MLLCAADPPERAAGRVVAMLRVVEGGLHEVGEGDGAGSPDPVGQFLDEGGDSGGGDRPTPAFPSQRLARHRRERQALKDWPHPHVAVA